MVWKWLRNEPHANSSKWGLAAEIPSQLPMRIEGTGQFTSMNSWTAASTLFLGRNNGFLQNPTDRPNSHLEKIQNEQETLKTKSSPLLIADFFQFQILLKQKNDF